MGWGQASRSTAVNSEVLRAVRYRFRATFAQRRGGYVAIVVLLALVGGGALGTLAGARRTQTSYPTYLASTNPADLEVFDAFVNPALGFTDRVSRVRRSPPSTVTWTLNNPRPPVANSQG